MKHSDAFWTMTASTYEKIITHPFNVELASGVLDKQRFLFYMEQDAYYLFYFSKALALIAGRTSVSRHCEQFLRFATGALIAERGLHAQFLALSDNLEPTPACFAYTNFLVATAATQSHEQAVAAVLPCFWIYREVGRHIAANAVRGNPYSKWIDTYSSQEFSDIVDEAICIFDHMAEQCSPKSIAHMQKMFTYSTLYEWHFWNDAYHLNTLPGSLFPHRDLHLETC